MEEVKIEKLVHGGQGLGTLPDGRKVFVWNALPDETVEVELTRNKKDYAEGFATRIITSHKRRSSYLTKEQIELSVSPWTIMDYTYELEQKSVIVQEAFTREGVALEQFSVKTCGSLQGYRNKIEFSFWGDDDGLHFAHYLRATHKKIKLVYPYSNLIPDQMAICADYVLRELNELGVRASDVKSLIIRSSNDTPGKAKVVMALFVKTKDFPKLEAPNLVVVYSNPKSPASVRTEDLYQNGDIALTDTLRGVPITYDVFSFFQVNLPIFEQALDDIASHTHGDSIVDLYSGVGTIGLALGNATALIESDANNIAMAKRNAAGQSVQVIHAPSEKALDCITGKHTVIVDPPRAGLHADVTAQLLQTQPKKIVYLSCNPSTQARDVALLAKGGYTITFSQGYNFFPLTPHIESLIVLELK